MLDIVTMALYIGVDDTENVSGKDVTEVSEKEMQAAMSMAEAIKDMDDKQMAVALAYVEGMRAQKQMQGDAECQN